MGRRESAMVAWCPEGSTKSSQCVLSILALSAKLLAQPFSMRHIQGTPMPRSCFGFQLSVLGCF